MNITPLAESPFVFLLIEEKKRRLCPNRVEVTAQGAYTICLCNRLTSELTVDMLM